MFRFRHRSIVPVAVLSLTTLVATTGSQGVIHASPDAQNAQSDTLDSRRSNHRVLSPVVSPTPGQTVSGFVSIEVVPEGPVSAVKWFVDGVEIGFDSNGAPWSKGWDSRTVSDGAHEVYSKSRQPASSPNAGRWFVSPTVRFVVDNSSPAASKPPPVPTGDLPGWRHVFADDFKTDLDRGEFPSDVSGKWGAYPSPWKDTSKKGRYDPKRVVSVDDGILRKDLRTVDGKPRVAALVPKIHDQKPYGSLYGRYSVRFRSDRVTGYKVAWLLWPDSGTNITGSASGTGGNGEIDFPELDLDSPAVKGFVHFQDATRRDDQYASKTSVDISDWHTYTIEWSPDLVVFLLDGVEVGRTTERVPNNPMHWVLQTETSLKKPTPAGASGSIEIDWVSVWAHEAGSDAGSPSGSDVTVLPAPPNVRGASQAKWYARTGGAWKQVAWDDGSKGWRPTWDTSKVAAGDYRVFSKVRIDGSWVSSAAVDVAVGSSAGSGSGSTALRAPVDLRGASQAKWYARIDGAWKQVAWDDGSKGWRPTWDTSKVTAGTYRVFTKVQADGRWASSEVFDVAVR